jgi:hypothetical protein
MGRVRFKVTNRTRLIFGALTPSLAFAFAPDFRPKSLIIVRHQCPAPEAGYRLAGLIEGFFRLAAGAWRRVALHRAGQTDAEWVRRELQRQAARRVPQRHLFANLKEARQIIEEWRIDDNTNRPHSSLNGLTPTEFAARPAEGHNRNRLSL